MATGKGSARAGAATAKTKTVNSVSEDLLPPLRFGEGGRGGEVWHHAPKTSPPSPLSEADRGSKTCALFIAPPTDVRRRTRLASASRRRRLFRRQTREPRPATSSSAGPAPRSTGGPCHPSET